MRTGRRVPAKIKNMATAGALFRKTLSQTNVDHAKLKRSTVVFHVTDLYSFRILGRSAPQLKRTSQCSKFKFFRRHLLVTSININWLALQKLILVCKTEMYLNYTLT